MRVRLYFHWKLLFITAAVFLGLTWSDFPSQTNDTATLFGLESHSSNIFNESGDLNFGPSTTSPLWPPQLENYTETSEIPAVVSEQDFVVNYKGKVVSFKALLQELLKNNVKLPVNTQDFLNAVIGQKNSSDQSCQGRCSKEERSGNATKSCYCDKDCKAWGDCCLDFPTRCGGSVDEDVLSHTMSCGDINDYSWSGVIMKSSCELDSEYNEYTNDCKSTEQLNMTLPRELPMFDVQNNITYRSFACARCNNAAQEALRSWGLGVLCLRRAGNPPQNNITAIKIFVKDKCSWKYQPFVNFSQSFKSCVVRDTHCDTQLEEMSLVKELCSSYSMVFSVKVSRYVSHFYRNPHCAICNPQGRQDWKTAKESDVSGGLIPPLGPPLSILLDVSSDAFVEKVPQVNQPTTQSNCTLAAMNCTVIFEGKTCIVIGSPTGNHSSLEWKLNGSRVNGFTALHENIPTTEIGMQHAHGNFVSIVCPIDNDKQKTEIPVVMIYITFIGSVLSIISLLFLVAVYLSVKELRNLPGKCLVSLSLALLCYQIIFRFTAISKEVEGLCTAVAIGLHYFFLAAFTWMSVIAFDTASTFQVQVKDPRKQAWDLKKTFIKYNVVGWAVPMATVVLCVTLDFSGTFHMGYGKQSQYCWISDKTAVAVAMVTPVSIALIFNAVCMTKIVYTIYQLRKGSGPVRNSHSRVPLLLVCIKLTTVMGLTWILIMIANWKQASFFHYPATVLNSMQGFFITLCFITTKRVRRILKQKLRKRHTRDHSSGRDNYGMASGPITFEMSSK
ncbi:uncharacterized protein [Montipora foliosa]|uniref:uncharacterized protein isoform X1 n=1 Tax=Montipora foliosa TaxID=591990 RepID=UPI0035F15216